MDLAKVPGERKLYLCQWYFRGNLISRFAYQFCNFFFVIVAGFAFLPFLWAVNAIWFFPEAFRRPEYDEQKQIKKCTYIFQ